MSKEKIYKIATKVRRWVEDLEAEHTQISEFDGFGRPSLMGRCVIASTKLMQELHKNDIDCYVALTDCHGYVVAGKSIVDVTATQFGMEDEVFIMPLSEAKKLRRGEILDDAYRQRDGAFYEFHTLDEIVSHQKLTGWPEDQSVSTFRRKYD
jgi:nitrogen regulatory protein PII